MKLTYGFEIEGIFSSQLYAELIDRPEPVGDFKYDRSVSVDDAPFSKAYAGDYAAKEYASPVYKNPEKMLLLLSKFDEDNHAFNRTCGLHLHIGAEEEQDRKKLFAIFCNNDLIKAMHKKALNFCSCQKARLQDSRWSESYFSLTKDHKDMVKDYKEKNKYRFLHFHNQGTLEFRFLCPCEHKVGNVEKVLSLVKKYIKDKLEEQHRIKVDTSPEIEDVEKKLKPEIQKQNFVFKEKYRAERDSVDFIINPIDEEVYDFNRRTYRGVANDVAYFSKRFQAFMARLELDKVLGLNN